MDATKIIVLVSSACGGKDVLLNQAIKKYTKLHKMVSVTTRPPRTYEQDGYDYHFRDYRGFTYYEGGFIETRIYNTEQGTWYYGLPKNEIIKGKTNIVIVDAQGTDELKSYCESMGYECISIYLKVLFKERIQRYINRDDMTDSKCFEMLRRFLDDKEKLETYSKECDYVWINETELDMLINLDGIGKLIERGDI